MIPIDYENELVTRSAPRWAWFRIDETLELDMRSIAFDPGLRDSIAEAYDAMKDVVVPTPARGSER